MPGPPAHLVRVEGTVERLRQTNGIDDVALHWASSREVSETRHAVAGVATDAGVERLRELGLDVEILEDAEDRAASHEAMAERLDESPEG
jgi:hypothetical protein